MPVPSWGANAGLLTSVAVLFLCCDRLPLCLFRGVSSFTPSFWDSSTLCSCSFKGRLHFYNYRSRQILLLEKTHFMWDIFLPAGNPDLAWQRQGLLLRGWGALLRCFILLCKVGAVGRAVVKPSCRKERQVTEIGLQAQLPPTD